MYIAQKGLKYIARGCYETTVQGIRILLYRLPNCKWSLFRADTGKPIICEITTLAELIQHLYGLNIVFDKEGKLNDCY